jgi:hypothetical protein
MTTGAMTPTTDKQAPDSWINRIELIIAAILQIGIAIITIGAFYEGLWRVAFSGSMVLLLTFSPAIIERRMRVPLPVEFTLLTSLFLFASFVLGEVSNFYERIWWWDLVLHGTSALLMGFIGFLTVYVFHMTHRITVKPLHVAAFTFGFAVTLGTLWEIFEFLTDWYLGTNMQKSGLVDTMTDMIINAFGALLAATVGFFYVRNGDSRLGQRLLLKVAAKKRLDSDKPRAD